MNIKPSVEKFAALFRSQHGSGAEAFVIGKAAYFRHQRPDLIAATLWNEVALALSAVPVSTAALVKLAGADTAAAQHIASKQPEHS